MSLITDIRNKLADAVSGVPGLYGYATVPDAPNVPCGIVAFAGRDPRIAFRQRGGQYQFSVTVLVARTASEQAQELLDQYVSPDDTKSVQAALEAVTTIGATPCAVQVTAIGPETAVVVDPVTYLGVEFSVAVVI